MEIFGIGGAELVAILIIMLVVAGPKRMIQWAYVLGQYTAKLRAMWAETMTYVQKEFEQAGMNVELPKDIPTRTNLNKQIAKNIEKVVTPVTKPMKDVLDETAAEVKQVKTGATISESAVPKTTSSPTSTASSNGNTDLGTWSGGSNSE
ncbi:MAG: hypothetical protein JNJ78_02280 [Anaerolineae bacterium]|nr:hypothetical protein [Anaerolineae bacterium]